MPDLDILKQDDIENIVNNIWEISRVNLPYSLPDSNQSRLNPEQVNNNFHQIFQELPNVIDELKQHNRIDELDEQTKQCIQDFPDKLPEQGQTKDLLQQLNNLITDLDNRINNSLTVWNRLRNTNTKSHIKYNILFPLKAQALYLAILNNDKKQIREHGQYVLKALIEREEWMTFWHIQNVLAYHGIATLHDYVVPYQDKNFSKLERQIIDNHERYAGPESPLVSLGDMLHEIKSRHSPTYIQAMERRARTAVYNGHTNYAIRVMNDSQSFSFSKDFAPSPSAFFITQYDFLMAIQNQYTDAINCVSELISRKEEIKYKRFKNQLANLEDKFYKLPETFILRALMNDVKNRAFKITPDVVKNLLPDKNINYNELDCNETALTLLTQIAPPSNYPSERPIDYGMRLLTRAYQQNNQQLINDLTHQIKSLNQKLSKHIVDNELDEAINNNNKTIIPTILHNSDLSSDDIMEKAKQALTDHSSKSIFSAIIDYIPQTYDQEDLNYKKQSDLDDLAQNNGLEKPFNVTPRPSSSGFGAVVELQELNTNKKMNTPHKQTLEAK